MILYHFCANRHIKNILHKGICIGGVTEILPTGYVVHSGWIWLTLNGNPKEQTWDGGLLIRYSRTAWRLTIDIPDKMLNNLYDKAKLLAIYPASEPLFSGHPESEAWRVFKGAIPATWIIQADDMRKNGGC